jgi:glyoxylase-like metal-dependent hydrolase (beta-lactamase superfamily II)
MRRFHVKRSAWLIVAALVLMGCTSSPEQSTVNAAAAALGGAQRIQAVNTLAIEGTGENTNLGQSLTPDAVNVFKVTQYKRSIDFANTRWRLEQTRVATFGPPNPQPQVQNFGVDGDVAYNVQPNGMAQRAAEQVAKDRRMETFHHPIGALRAALAQGAQLSNPRTEGSDSVVDITTAQGDKLTLYVDSGTKLPSKVVSMTSNNTNWLLGDVTVETSFADYADVEGLKLPSRISMKTDQYPAGNVQVTKQTVNGDAGDLAAPEAAKSAAAPPAIPPPMVTAEEVGRGIWYLAGQSHHSILVEFADHLALIEAPQNEIRTSAVLAKVKELKPDKPLRYVVNTHAHFDHSGGLRRIMAEDGVTIITHAGNKSFYEAIAQRPSTIYPDTLSKSPKPPKIETVTDKYELKDASRTVEIHHIPNLHSETMLIVYFPAERLLIEADLYNPPAPNTPPPPQGFPNARSVAETVQKLGLRVDRVMPIHGFIIPYRNLEAAVRATAS